MNLSSKLAVSSAIAVMTLTSCASDTPSNWALTVSEDSGYNCVPARGNSASVAIEIVTNQSDTNIQVADVWLEGSSDLEVSSWGLLPVDSTLAGVRSGTIQDLADESTRDLAAGAEAVVAYQVSTASSALTEQPAQVVMDYTDASGRKGQAYLQYGVALVPEGTMCSGDQPFEPLAN